MKNGEERMKEVCLINFTGSKGGGAMYTIELTKGLINQGVPIVAVISSLNEDIAQWKELKLEKLVVIDTYATPVELIKNSLRWNSQRNKIQTELKGFEVSQIIVPMITFWTKRINNLFKDAKTIVALHDPIPHSGDKNKKAIQLFGETAVLKKAEYIVVLSSMFIDYTEKKYSKKDKVIYIPIGTTNTYKNIPDKIQSVNYDDNKTNFLFFGTISHYKGIGILAKAYRKVTEKNSNVSLTIAGSGDFSKYSEDFSVLPHVDVHNRWIKNEEVESFFNHESVVAVLPYLDATQSGVIPVCIAYANPIIASKTGGIVEQLNQFETGILVEVGNSDALADAMLYLANDKEARSEHKRTAEENAEKFNWDNIGSQFAALLK